MTLIAAQTLQSGAGLAVAQQVAPRWAGALEATRSVDAPVGTGLWQLPTLINVCPQHRERPAPGSEGKEEEKNSKEERDGG